VQSNEEGRPLATAEKTAAAFLAALFAAEKWVAIAAFALIAVLLFADVLGRELFGHGLFWAQRASVYAATVAGLLGFSLCVAKGAHLRPSSFDKLAPAGWGPAMNRAADLISAAICLFLAIYGANFVVNSFALGERGQAIDMPLWPVQMILPYCFVSAMLRYLAYAAFPALRPVESEAA